MADLCQASQRVLVAVCAGCSAHAGTIPDALLPCACKHLSSYNHVASVLALLFGCMGAGVKLQLWQHRCFELKRSFLASFELR